MDILGFNSEYVVHGGDLGSDTGRVLGTRHASCKAVHICFCYLAEPLSSQPLELDDVDRIGLERGRKFASMGNPYTKEHSYNGDLLQTSRVTGTVRLRGYTWVGPISSGFRAAQDERTTRPDNVWTL